MWDWHPFLRNVTYYWRWLWPKMRQLLKPLWSTLDVLVWLDLVKSWACISRHCGFLYARVLKCSAIIGIATSHLPTRLADQCRRGSRKLVSSWGGGTLPHSSILMRAEMLILVTVLPRWLSHNLPLESHQSSVSVRVGWVQLKEGSWQAAPSSSNTTDFTRINKSTSTDSLIHNACSMSLSWIPYKAPRINEPSRDF